MKYKQIVESLSHIVSPSKLYMGKYAHFNGHEDEYQKWYAVVNTDTNEIVGVNNPVSAKREKDVYNEHEVRNNRPEIYTLVKLTDIPKEILLSKGK
jgi:hypothetical protein